MLGSYCLLSSYFKEDADAEALARLVFVTSFVHIMTKFPERREEHIFDALSDPKKANMEDR